VGFTLISEWRCRLYSSARLSRDDFGPSSSSPDYWPNLCKHGAHAAPTRLCSSLSCISILARAAPRRWHRQDGHYVIMWLLAARSGRRLAGRSSGAGGRACAAARPERVPSGAARSPVHRPGPVRRRVAARGTCHLQVPSQWRRGRSTPRFQRRDARTCSTPPTSTRGISGSSWLCALVKWARRPFGGRRRTRRAKTTATNAMRSYGTLGRPSPASPRTTEPRAQRQGGATWPRAEHWALACLSCRRRRLAIKWTPPPPRLIHGTLGRSLRERAGLSCEHNCV
jgi:hypothetical protein